MNYLYLSDLSFCLSVLHLIWDVLSSTQNFLFSSPYDYSEYHLTLISSHHTLWLFSFFFFFLQISQKHLVPASFVSFFFTYFKGNVFTQALLISYTGELCPAWVYVICVCPLRPLLQRSSFKLVTCSYHSDKYCVMYFSYFFACRILVSCQIFYSMQSHMGQEDMAKYLWEAHPVITCRQTGSKLASKIMSTFRQLHMKLQFHLLLLFLLFFHLQGHLL